MAIQFVEVSQNAGIRWKPQKNYDSFSVNWVDFNKDGFLDLWMGSHGAYTQDKYPLLYINQQNGTFRNSIQPSWFQRKKGDAHGTSWIDIDNDDDPDVLVTHGALRGTGTVAKSLFINNNGQLSEQAVLRGLDFPAHRGRTSLWFDWNKDRRLDVLMTGALRPDGQAPTSLFQQQADGTFVNISSQVGLNVNFAALYGQLSDITGDGQLDLVLHGDVRARYPTRIYDFSSGVFQDVTALVPQARPNGPDMKDSVIADFDGDLRPDMFVARSRSVRTGSSLFQAEKLIAADLILQTPGEVGVQFATQGAVFFDFLSGSTMTLAPSQIFIGASGWNPQTSRFALPAPSQDPSVIGIQPHTPGQSPGLYIGYDTNAGAWKALFSGPGTGANPPTLRLLAQSLQPMTGATAIGFTPANPADQALSSVLLGFDAVTGKYTYRSFKSGLAQIPMLANSVVAGDFDNDMDVDLFVASDAASYHVPNMLYENRGNGTFKLVPQAGGAAGQGLGPHQMDFDQVVGSRIVMGDYDNDGFLDIFSGSTVVFSQDQLAGSTDYSGQYPTAPGGEFSYLGNPYQLFRNQGNSNRWIQLQLKGTVSNRDGIGARVLATAGGITQLREQDGGMHLFAQNQQRIHFGLRQNNRVDRLAIRWPSGVVQQLNNVAVNQILSVVETNGTAGNDRISLARVNPSQNGAGSSSQTRSLSSLESSGYILEGKAGADWLIGSRSGDILIGGAGADQLTGGAGRDLFRYLEMGDQGDRINDFDPQRDRLDLQPLLASLGYVGSDPVAAGYLQLAQLDGATEVWIDPDAAGFAQPQMLVRLAQVLPSDLNF